ncbi:hypothetical protein D4764_08G0006700 [Takifugu flavidus]|uniref:Uncharacterized protein n=1 Tax=Takifugu flavidus TaxID=433684 RepID=A0A5C6MPC1_9TELE|nr:hypothetical protein D4764_08G0006700 [Takifugu flavidus]
MGSTWCHLSGFYGLEELTNLRYIHIIYNLNCPESQLLAAPYLGKKGLCGTEDAQPSSGLRSCSGAPGALVDLLVRMHGNMGASLPPSKCSPSSYLA